MILNSQPKQFRLQDDGQILWQQDASNPLPGVPVAQVVKGGTILTPEVMLGESEALAGQDREAVAAFVRTWLHTHISTVLEKLSLLKAEGVPAGPVAEIAQKLHDAMGILPRHELSAQIAALDAETRRALRQLHVRLGPLLVFIPELNKPAPVRLRALLWSLWHGKALPAPLPRDGAVSVVMDETQVDPAYQLTIGYPVYAGRAIRVDMLDRLVCAIYDSSEKGLFKATHAMAEWLGCSIPELYKVLEAMGHKKESDPADQPGPEAAIAESAPVAVVPEAVQAPDAAVAEAMPDPVPETAAAPEAATPTETPVAPVSPAKPELATFRLKRGRADSAERSQEPRAYKGKREGERREDRRPEGGEKPERKQDRPHKPRPDKARHDKPRHDRKPEPREKKVFVLEALPEKRGDSPFAMLQQLKVAKKD